MPVTVLQQGVVALPGQRVRSSRNPATWPFAPACARASPLRATLAVARAYGSRAASSRSGRRSRRRRLALRQGDEVEIRRVQLATRAHADDESSIRPARFSGYERNYYGASRRQRPTPGGQCFEAGQQVVDNSHAVGLDRGADGPAHRSRSGIQRQNTGTRGSSAREPGSGDQAVPAFDPYCARTAARRDIGRVMRETASSAS